MGAQGVAVAALDRLPDPPVQLHPGRDRQPLVQHLPDQGVGEAIPADGAVLLGDHVQCHRLRQPAEHALHRKLAGGPHQRQVELPAHHRRRRQHHHGVGGQWAQSPRDHRPHAPRQRHPKPAGVLQGGVGGQQPHGLPDEQRVAFGRLVDGGNHGLGGLRPGERLDEPADLASVQAPKAEQMALAYQLPHRVADPVPAVRRHVAVGPDDQQPGAARVSGQELQQQQGGVVGRLQVLHDQHQRPHRRRLPQEPGDRLEEREAGGVGHTRGPREGSGRPEALGQARHQLGDRGRPRTQPVGQGLVVEVLGEGTDHLGPWPERRGAPSLPAANPQHPSPSPGRVVRQVLGQPRLADPGLPRDQQQPHPPADRVLEAGHQLGHLPVPAHERPPCSRAGGIPWLNHLSTIALVRLVKVPWP